MYVFWIPLIGRLNIIASWHKRQKTGVIFLLDFVLISAPNKLLVFFEIIAVSQLPGQRERQRERERVCECVYTYTYTYTIDMQIHR